VPSVDKELVEQLCAYFGLGTIESFRPVAFQAHFGGVGRITRATLKYRRDITNHVFRVRGLVALEQADSRGVADPPTNEAAAHSRNRPLHVLGGFDTLSLPEHFLRFQVFSGF
jgi:hypothetical protein